MSKTLPPTASLEYLRKEAKDLLERLKQGDRSGLPVVGHLRRLKGRTDDQIMASATTDLSLQEVQLCLAIEYGFKDWAALHRSVESMTKAYRTPRFRDVEELAATGNRVIQMVLRDADDWAVALTSANGSSNLRQQLLENMTARHRERIEVFPEIAVASLAHIAEARTQMVGILNRLAEMGEIPLAAPSGPEDRVAQIRGARESFLEKAGAALSSQRSTAELVPMFVALAEVIRRHGLITLDTIAAEFFDEEMLQEGMRMTADGHYLDVIEPRLENLRKDLRARYGRRLEAIIEGVLNVSSAKAPEDATERLAAEMGGKRVSGRSTEELGSLFDALYARAAREGLIGLESIVAWVDEDLFHTGLKLAVDGADTELVREIMETRKKTLLAGHDTRMDMIVAACDGIGRGNSSYIMEEKCRAML